MLRREYYTCFIEFVGYKPNARSSRLCRVREKVRPLWIFYTQSFPAFLQEAISKTCTHDLMVGWSQGNSCPGKGPTTLGLLYAVFPCIFCKWVFPRLVHMTTWSVGHKATTLPLRQGSPSDFAYIYLDEFN